jgi:hypothetical protein
MPISRVAVAFLLAPGVAPLGIALASLLPSLAGIWVLAVGVAAFTYGTTAIAGIPAYSLLRYFNWVSWWHFTLGGAVLGILPTLVFGFPSSLQGMLVLGPDYLAIGAITGLVFWAIAFSRAALPLRDAA